MGCKRARQRMLHSEDQDCSMKREGWEKGLGVGRGYSQTMGHEGEVGEEKRRSRSERKREIDAGSSLLGGRREKGRWP